LKHRDQRRQAALRGTNCGLTRHRGRRRRISRLEGLPSGVLAETDERACDLEFARSSADKPSSSNCFPSHEPAWPPKRRPVSPPTTPPRMLPTLGNAVRAALFRRPPSAWPVLDEANDRNAEPALLIRLPRNCSSSCSL
jgi:hypothetical protein